MQVFALVANFCPLPTRRPHCRTARMSSNTCVCLIRLLIVVLSLLVLVSRSNLIAGSSEPQTQQGHLAVLLIRTIPAHHGAVRSHLLVIST
ncbi:hypothetical protein PVAP13_4NG177200 [Panicum virgatum]|uniref:Uncharacterized protein n=1 Tax=Panicum virgatum TaxID=38727 RepID=A0A8T0TCF7_PANVG|nr:hypothetical protein PVAP13_4NG177200 [Panicum virgatum]